MNPTAPRDRTMEFLTDLGLDPELIGIAIVIGLVAFFIILLPLSAFAAQRWAYRTYRETQQMNANLTELIALLRKSQTPLQRSEDTSTPAASSHTQRREPTINTRNL